MSSNEVRVVPEIEMLLAEAGLLASTDTAGEREEEGERTVEALASRAGMTPEQFAKFLADEYHLAHITQVDASKVDPKAVTLIPQTVARRHRLLPLFVINGRLIAAVASPLTLNVLSQISQEAKIPIDPVIATPEQIDDALVEIYSDLDQIGVAGDGAETESNDILYDLNKSPEDGEGGVIRLVDLILRQGINEGVSDIHIDPEETLLAVRYRVAGILRDVKRLPNELAAGVISRVKILAGLDIAEHRLPQDGRIGVTYRHKEIDLRVSTLPTVIGEKVVMRILDKSKSLVGLDQLGFLPQTEEAFTQIISRPYGVFLITGPTGSGKTTTLYAGINRINTREKNFITFEDPVEYRLAGVNQVNVKPKAGLTFASGLRASLRQDPDVLLVGEIRDRETAEIVFNAALTGHFVFSTFHTNDAPSAIARLRDLEVEPFLIATALAGVSAQRLVRRICTGCRAAFPADAALCRQLGIPASFGDGDVKVFRGLGCRECGGTGYKGQVAIFELMPIDDNLRGLILERASTKVLLQKAREFGMLTIWEYGVITALQGTTTIEEVLRVTRQHM